MIKQLLQRRLGRDGQAHRSDTIKRKEGKNEIQPHESVWKKYVYIAQKSEPSREKSP